MPFAVRGSQASAKPRQLLQGTEGVEISLDTWTEFLFRMERCYVSLRSGRKRKCYNRKQKEGTGFSPCKQLPQLTWVCHCQEVNKESTCCNYSTSKAIQWKILHRLLACMPLLLWNPTSFSCILPWRNGCLIVYTKPESNLLYKLKPLMKSLILFLIQYSTWAIIKKV